jgi:hypothetical protein
MPSCVLSALRPSDGSKKLLQLALRSPVCPVLLAICNLWIARYTGIRALHPAWRPDSRASAPVATYTHLVSHLSSLAALSRRYDSKKGFALEMRRGLYELARVCQHASPFTAQGQFRTLSQSVAMGKSKSKTKPAAKTLDQTAALGTAVCAPEQSNRGTRAQRATSRQAGSRSVATHWFVVCGDATRSPVHEQPLLCLRGARGGAGSRRQRVSCHLDRG